MTHVVLVLIAFFAVSCKDEAKAKPAFDPESALLGERLIAKHGEGVLAAPVVVPYDSGFVVGRESLDAEFSSKVEALGVAPTNRLALGRPPVHVTEYFSEQDVEFAVSAADKVVVADAGSTLTVRLLLGEPGLEAVQQCGQYKVTRVCKGDEQIRVRLDGVPATGATLVDGGLPVAKASIKGDWAIFEEVPELSDEVELELTLSDRVSCNFSKWVIDPRDSCVL